MFFIKNYIIKFLISENNKRTPDTYYFINNDYEMLKSLQGFHQTRHRTGRKYKKLRKTKKKSFPKELAENVDPFQPVLNKIMTTHE